MIKQNVIMIFKTNCYKININVMKRRKMKEIHMKKLNNDKKDGITLILLLVVTMVVLLILAGVSINAVVGDDRVIKSAQESTKLTEESEAKKIMNKVVL